MSVQGRESMPPGLHWTVLCLPKHGNTEDEYEDAWAADPTRGRFAIADGASESSFAGRWAQLLTEGFLTAARPTNLPGWLTPPRRRWSAEVMGLELPWYAEMKREQGAYATLLGVGVRFPTADRPGRWKAVAVGDSCLIQVRRGGEIRSFPIRKSADFGNQPRLIGSRGGHVGRPDYASDSLLLGDRLWLMTDALAQWFLHAHENGRRPAQQTAAVMSAEDPDSAFAACIERLRKHDGLRNDDMTLVGIDFASPPKE